MRGIASPSGGRFHANSKRRIVAAQAAWRGAMAKGIQHYHKRLRRKAINETTAACCRWEHADGFYVVISEVGPTTDKYGFTTGYHLHSVSWQRYVTLKEGISEAEIAFDSSLRMGF
jgi:hypothetical protein